MIAGVRCTDLLVPYFFDTYGSCGCTVLLPLSYLASRIDVLGSPVSGPFRGGRLQGDHGFPLGVQHGVLVRRGPKGVLCRKGYDGVGSSALD